MNQKGVLVLPLLLVIGVTIILSALFLLKPNNTIVNLPQDAPFPVTSSDSVLPLDSPTPIASSTTKETVKDTKSNCDLGKDICFESNNLEINIQEGYLEDSLNTGKWISDQIVLSGKGSGGFELKLEGFGKEFGVRSPVQNFKDGTKQKIYVQTEKDLTKKGTYSGKILVKSLLSGNTQSANLKINYIDWNTSAIHTDPKEVVFNCTVGTSGSKDNRYMNCGDYDSTHKMKFYYYGDHKSVEIRSIPDKDSKRSLWLRASNFDTTFEVHDTKTLNIDTAGFPENNRYLDVEPTATYRGYFSFVDPSTQKEILKVPYTLNFTAEKMGN